MIVYNTTECKEHPGYYHLQQYPNYCINESGDVKVIPTGKSLSGSVTKPGKKSIKGGYVKFRIVNADFVITSVGRHQLLCQTFKAKPEGNEKYVVNHINGIPGDDRLENLEWVTYAQNTQHAYENGLYPSKERRLLVKFMEDGTIVEYKYLAAAARALGVSENLIRTRLKKYPGRFYSDGYAFKLADVGEWSDEKPLSAMTYRSFRSRNIITGEIHIFNSVAVAEKLLGIRDSCIILSLSKPGSLLNGYEFKLNSDHTPWRELSEEQIATHFKYPHGHYPLQIQLTHLTTNEIITFDDSIEAGRFLGRTRCRVVAVAKANGVIGDYRLACKKIL